MQRGRGGGKWMVREAEENKRGNERIMESKGKEVINPETHLRNRQIEMKG